MHCQIATAGVLIIGLVSATLPAAGQGTLHFFNGTAPTRIGSFDGPLAGTNIAAHLFVGVSPDDLSPVGPTQGHYPGGIVFGGGVVVPDIPPFAAAYVQMWAWNGQLWGLSLDAVPADQIGRTDIVRVVLSGGTLPPADPDFTLPAVVPPVPEPSAIVLGALGAALLFFWKSKLRSPVAPPAAPSVSIACRDVEDLARVAKSGFRLRGLRGNPRP